MDRRPLGFDSFQVVPIQSDALWLRRAARDGRLVAILPEPVAKKRGSYKKREA